MFGPGEKFRPLGDFGSLGSTAEDPGIPAPLFLCNMIGLEITSRGLSFQTLQYRKLRNE